MKKSNCYLKKWKSPIGELYLYSDEKNLLALTYPDNNSKTLKKLQLYNLVNSSSPIIDETIIQLQEYFENKRKKFNIPFNMIGTEFQERAWKELGNIPFGKTISYTEQAIKIKSEKAVRAIGTANGKNLIAIIIPCHRVVSSNGKISGYSGGSAIKEKLLQIEKKKVQ